MSNIKRIINTPMLAVGLALWGPAAAVHSADEAVFQLDNGIEVILKENHSSPMIASMIFVRSGSRYESAYENGITHFLEHLLFDGTVHMTREQIDASIRDLGGMVNAFTRKDMTCYFTLLPKQYNDYGLNVLADMLFNSVIPEAELAKERKVVIEEIRRDKDSPGAAARAFFIEKAYAHTNYDRPVLGYQGFIDNIPREAIIDYWKHYYIPSNMTALIVGDFDSGQMRQSVQKIFGGGERAVRAQKSGLTRELYETAEVYDTVASVTSTYIDFSFAAPRHDTEDYLAMDLLAQYLDMDDISPLIIALKGGAEPLATEASVSLNTRPEFSRLEISVITENPDNADTIVATVLDQVGAIAQHSADIETLEGIKTSVKTNDIYTSEKLYFLAFMIGPRLMTSGWESVASYPDDLGRVQWSDCRRAAERRLRSPDYVATIVRPVGESGKTPYAPYEMPAEEVAAHFDSVQFAAYDLEKGRPLTFPSTDSVILAYEDRAQYSREILDNGLTVIIKSNPDTRVFGMNIIGKNRSAGEAAGKAGITDFVNRCLDKGTVTRDASELARDLARIGANVTLCDNPWIPYDDRYTTRRFSFMKFETIDEYAEKGFHLFSDMILYPSFDSAEVENVRRSMMGTLGRQSASPGNVARDAFFATLFEGKAYASPIMGSPQTLAMISAEDLKTHHAAFYSPANMILTITSNQPVERVREWVGIRFGRLSYPPLEPTAAEPPEPIFETKVNHTDLDKEQVSIYIGNALPGADNPDVAAIKVATAILSNRLALNLREKQGLAYSVGSNAVFDRRFGWFYSTIGTASTNYRTALDGIILEIEKLRYDGPTGEELTRARNQLWGSLMRAKLSSVNQAYYLGVDEYLGRPLGYDGEFLKALSEVTFDSVRRVAAQYFRTDACVLATAGKLP
ncbi:MAG: insulinase family protein [Candidatus Zixiibacteriota bacterium]|nr:MAG: insulinase family protein [candidate division Zixibacteria bacterium]